MPDTISAINGSCIPAGACFNRGSEPPSDTSVTTQKKRLRFPRMVTKEPTLTSSTVVQLLPPPSRTSSPWPNEPPTTNPNISLLNCFPFRLIPSPFKVTGSPSSRSNSTWGNRQTTLLPKPDPQQPNIHWVTLDTDQRCGQKRL